MVFFSLSKMFSQQVNFKINSTPLSSNNLNYVVGTTFVNLTYTTNSNFQKKDIINVDNQNKESIKIFPNPTENRIYISGKGITTQTEFEVYNDIGQLLFKQELSNDYIDLSNFSKGVYFIVPILEKSTAFKIIKN